MLTLENLVLERGGFRLTADWSLPEGTIAAVIGPSGGGKSTLLDAVAGFLAPSAGRLLCAGRDLSPLSPGARPVAMLFQDNNLFPHLTAAQNVALALTPKRRLTTEQTRAIDNALTRVGLAGLGTRKPAQLSGGQQGRVALARTLLQRRPLFLLDEPFAALGPAQRAEMLDLVATLAREQGASVLMVSHAPEDARRIADSVVLVAEGRAEAPAETAALFADPPPALRAYLG